MANLAERGEQGMFLLVVDVARLVQLRDGRVQLLKAVAVCAQWGCLAARVQMVYMASGVRLIIRMEFDSPRTRSVVGVDFPVDFVRGFVGGLVEFVEES